MTSRPGGTTARRPVRRPGSAPRAPSTVSSASAARFAARVRARRLRRAAAVATVVAVVAGTTWALLFSPWATVRQIRVTGLDRVSQEQIQAIGRTQMGSSLLLVDTGKLARAVRGLDLVRAVTVRRSWPSTLVIEVSERTAVAAVPVSGGVVLVDAGGEKVEQTTQVPEGLPVIRVDLSADGGTAAFRSALAVWDGLPDDVVAKVRRIGAEGADGVWTLQSDGSRVLWGSSSELGTKVEALRALWALPRSARPANTLDYDVSAPRAPAVRPRD